MHSFYLRSLYLRNELARGELTLAGQRLALPDVGNDTYVVGAVNDHIVPWEASYHAGRLLGGDVRCVLSSGGHIAGVVNPPGPKAQYQVMADEHPPAPAEWRAAASAHEGSWWEDWTSGSARRAGQQVSPPPRGSDQYPPLAEAPGSYVHE